MADKANRRASQFSKPKIVVIGGGTGVSTVLTELKKVAEVTAIVSTMDSGGSSGRLRDENGILPPGDILKCISELMPDDCQSVKWRDILNYRFRKGNGLKGHSLGNLLLAAAYDWEGGTSYGIELISWLLNIQGNVLPVTLNDVHLIAKLSDGTDLEGETNIDLRTNDLNRSIEYIYLSHRAQIFKPAYEAILAADKIVIGPGSLFTSILPNFLVEGLSEALNLTRATKIYICNLVTDPSETHQYKAGDFIQKITDYLVDGDLLDFMIVNTGPIGEMVRRMYEKEDKYPVVFDPENCKRFLRGEVITGNYCKGKTILRHDSARLAHEIVNIGQPLAAPDYAQIVSIYPEIVAVN